MANKCWSWDAYPDSLNPESKLFLICNSMVPVQPLCSYLHVSKCSLPVSSVRNQISYKVLKEYSAYSGDIYLTVSGWISSEIWFLYWRHYSWITWKLALAAAGRWNLGIFTYFSGRGNSSRVSMPWYRKATFAFGYCLKY